MKVFWEMGGDGDVGGDGGAELVECFFEVYYFVVCILNNVK
ncbi:hypothetical protein [Geofilum rhodophaeum]|nr:hypothetical protein [Geofilum rhodophaeum]